MLIIVALPNTVLGTLSEWLFGFQYLRPQPAMVHKIMAAAGILPLLVGWRRLIKGEADGNIRKTEVGGKELIEWFVLVLFLTATNLVVCGQRSYDGLALSISGEKPLALPITLLYSMLLLFIAMINRERFGLELEDTGRGGAIEPGRMLIGGAIGIGIGLFLSPFAVPAIGGVNGILYLVLAKPAIQAGLVYFCFGYTYNMIVAMTGKRFGAFVAAATFALVASPVWWWHIALNFVLGLALVSIKDKLKNLPALWLLIACGTVLPGLMNGLSATMIYLMVLPVTVALTVAVEVYFRRSTALAE